MHFLPMILTTALAFADEPVKTSAPSREQVHQAVERSLVFLEQSGTKWWTRNKCASCHHIPISIWSMSEAKKRRFKVDDTSLDQLRNWAVPSYANHPKLRPVGQDGDDKGSSISMNTIYLTLSVTAAGKLDEKTATALKKFTSHLLAGQGADGSWKSPAKLPPVGDVTEVRTMQILLALAAAEEKGLVDKTRWTTARDRALAWLSKHKFIDQNQSLNLRVLVAQRFGKPAELQPLVKQLLAQQEPDGGWSQTRRPASEPIKDYEGKKTAPAKAEKRPSDAMATGQTLYVLASAGVAVIDPAIRHGQAFLVRTQTKDGSWKVPIRSQKNTGTALSHYGTGWATLGLMQTLPAVSAKSPSPASASQSAR